ncbi:alpha-methylacyl-CoA racemase-like protein [Sarcoptes scabiei]|uniref:Alpha-methylacyl-CoA racemase-like protein n=1 Tax=Sarcoptes scabiei TaxID=52283 RepID=A0A131ZV72_SARSC|nr:alpha-methylacyl-CoA racemase-like protein [Sarcoptes scabiei]
MGPLKGIKVLELVGIGPGPFLGKILNDFGAEIVRMYSFTNFFDTSNNPEITIDLKHPQSVEICRRLASRSDVLIDPYRPGVLERLNLGPETLLKLNDRLVIARLTGYGQTGPFSQKGSHDLNFLALSGVLSLIGYEDKPPIAPLNLVGDFGGGSMLGAFAIVAALYERSLSGRGQIIDHSLTEGTGYISTFVWQTMKFKPIFWPNFPRRNANLLDNGCPFYRCYECADKKFIAVASGEEKFYENLLAVLKPKSSLNRFDIKNWPSISEEFARIIRTKTRDEWCELFDKTDACVTPVLELDEASLHHHNLYRKSFDREKDLPLPAPRFSRTILDSHNDSGDEAKENESNRSNESTEILKQLNFSDSEIDKMSSMGIFE